MERKNNQREKSGGKARGQVEKVKMGISVNYPSGKCMDPKCPFHGNLKVRGRTFAGEVLTKDTHKTAVVGWPRLIRIKKYERYAKRRTRVKVHNPECINAIVGDKVMIVECRPLSKTKSFVIVEKK